MRGGIELLFRMRGDASLSPAAQMSIRRSKVFATTHAPPSSVEEHFHSPIPHRFLFFSLPPLHRNRHHVLQSQRRPAPRVMRDEGVKTRNDGTVRADSLFHFHQRWIVAVAWETRCERGVWVASGVDVFPRCMCGLLVCRERWLDNHYVELCRGKRGEKRCVRILPEREVEYLGLC